MPSIFRRSLAAVSCCLLLASCATVVSNPPANRAITPAFQAQVERPRDIVGRNVVALALSGGGLRAAAFSLGVLQAIEAADAGPAGGEVWDDLSFIASVSGGSLTAAYVALEGRPGVARMRTEVLGLDLEAGLRTSLWSPWNWSRLLAGGLNDRSNLASTLDTRVFRGATFAELLRRNKPDVWIHATDLYNRTPFPFTPQAFATLCSDLTTLPVSEAVAASMAVPLVFSPVVLRTFPEHCLRPLPPSIETLLADPTRVATDPAAATARAMRNYRDPSRMRYLKLADGGLTDNQGLATILIARTIGGTPYAPLTEADAVRIRRMVFLIVDAGRPPDGAWALELDGPSGVEVGIAAADAAVDSATRLSADAFRTMMGLWRDAIVAHRCSLAQAQVRRYIAAGEPWRCDDVEFMVGTISAESLDPAQARRLREMPTRLNLPPADVDAAIAAGRAATQSHPVWRRYLAARVR